jgi:predicted nucleic acid-binding protein
VRQVIYFDTSALAKWYIREARSEEVAKYIQDHGPIDMSDLTIVEMRALLARRRRERNIGSQTEIRIYATFEEDMRQKFLVCHPLPTDFAAAAANLLSTFPNLPLRTLDALHLTIAKEIQAEILATADRVMADGAKAMGFSVIRFDKLER